MRQVGVVLVARNKVNRGTDADWSGGPAPRKEETPERVGPDGLPAPHAPEVRGGGEKEHLPAPIAASSSPGTHEIAIPRDLQEEAKGYFDESLSENTRAAYASDWRQFEAWCRDEQRTPLPATAGTVVGYLTHLARSHPWSTITRHLSSIAARHAAVKVTCVCVAAGRTQGCPLCEGTGKRIPDSPRDMLEVRRLCRGIRRTKGTFPVFQKKALVREDVEKVVASIPADGLMGIRDRAILLLGFAGAFRRSELAALDREHLDFEARGLVVFLARSKTDQEGKGAYVGVSAEAVRTIAAVREWIEKAGVVTGPVFRPFALDGTLKSGRLTPAGVGKAFLRALVGAGILEKTPRRKPAGEKRRIKSFGAHSLRSGYATQAKRDGRTIDEIMGQGRWVSHRQAMAYVRRESVFDNPGTRGIAL